MLFYHNLTYLRSHIPKDSWYEYVEESLCMGPMNYKCVGSNQQYLLISGLCRSQVAS